MTPSVPSQSNRPESDPNEEVPDVPGLKTWPGVYLAVIGSFVITVILLTFLPRFFE